MAETISEYGLDKLKDALLEATDMYCRNCGEKLHLVGFKQRGFTDNGGAVAAGELSCPKQRWWKIWQKHKIFWLEVTINGYCVWERIGFRDNEFSKGSVNIPWYKILVGEHY